MPVSGHKVKLSEQEMSKIKNFDLVGMKLMGFKPRSYLKVYHNIKNSYFVYPDESKIEGSS
jgi:ATP-dependent DNA helicase 2 subunit 1